MLAASPTRPAAALAVAAVVVACSPASRAPAAGAPAAIAPASDPAPTSAPRRELARGAFADGIMAAMCRAAEGCCGEASAKHDEARCVSERMTTKLEWPKVVADMDEYHGEHAAECIDEAAALAKSCKGDLEDVLDLPHCRATFGGAVLPGGACARAAECALPRRGRITCWTGGQGQLEGRCTTILPPTVGADCYTPLSEADGYLDPMSECADDPTMRCDKTTNKCAARLAAGAACEQSGECERGATCANGRCKATTGAACKRRADCGEQLTCTRGRCAPRRAKGEPCVEPGDCIDGQCGVTRRCGTWAAANLCFAP